MRVRVTVTVTVTVTGSIYYSVELLALIMEVLSKQPRTVIISSKYDLPYTNPNIWLALH